MGKWLSASGAKICLTADPNQLSATGMLGELQLGYDNPAYVPLTASIAKVGSSDPKVANPTSTTPKVHIPGKLKGKRSATGSPPIGTWAPLSYGGATLDVDVDLYDRFGNRQSFVKPSDDVSVT